MKWVPKLGLLIYSTLQCNAVLESNRKVYLLFLLPIAFATNKIWYFLTQKSNFAKDHFKMAIF